MRTLIPLLVVLQSASAAQASLDEIDGVVQSTIFGAACCGLVPLLLLFALGIQDWRKTRRLKPPPPEE